MPSCEMSVNERCEMACGRGSGVHTMVDTLDSGREQSSDVRHRRVVGVFAVFVNSNSSIHQVVSATTRLVSSEIATDGRRSLTVQGCTH
jgi:hypothetical protein